MKGSALRTMAVKKSGKFIKLMMKISFSLDIPN